MDKLELKALGKINLGLDVAGAAGEWLSRCAHGHADAISVR